MTQNQENPWVVNTPIQTIRSHASMGTSQYNSYGLFPSVTDGVMYVLHTYDPKFSMHNALFNHRALWRGRSWVQFEFIFQGDNQAILQLSDGNEVYFTSAPLKDFTFQWDGTESQKFWLIRGVLLLPEEY